jgi:hypothetical protein
MSLSVCAAVTENLILLFPSGTVGGLIAGANIFFLRRKFPIFTASFALPARRGIIGVSDAGML